MSTLSPQAQRACTAATRQCLFKDIRSACGFKEAVIYIYMYVCVCVYVCIYMYIYYTCICIHTRTHAHAHTRTVTLTHTHTHAHTQCYGADGGLNEHRRDAVLTVYILHIFIDLNRPLIEPQ